MQNLKLIFFQIAPVTENNGPSELLDLKIMEHR